MSATAKPTIVKSPWSITPKRVIASDDPPATSPKSNPKDSPRPNGNDKDETHKQKIFYIELDTPGARISDQGPTGDENGLSPVVGSKEIEDDENEDPDSNIHWYYGDLTHRMTIMNKYEDKIASGLVPDPNK
jgi:hypothetical protein